MIVLRLVGTTMDRGVDERSGVWKGEDIVKGGTLHRLPRFVAGRAVRYDLADQHGRKWRQTYDIRGHLTVVGGVSQPLACILECQTVRAGDAILVRLPHTS